MTARVEDNARTRDTRVSANRAARKHRSNGKLRPKSIIQRSRAESDRFLLPSGAPTAHVTLPTVTWDMLQVTDAI